MVSTAPSVSEETLTKTRYQVTGCAAYSRLVPLLPSDWIDLSPYNNAANVSLQDGTAPDFLWENAPRHETQRYRDIVKCYSHLPNGKAVLDDKWALARLFSTKETKQGKSPTRLATLESHCFRGLTGFRMFSNRVDMWSSENEKPSYDSDGQFPDLLKSHEAFDFSQIPPSPQNLWVVKDANSNGAGGIWIVGPQNAKEFAELTTPLLEEH
jgi:hypothetical protein